MPGTATAAFLGVIGAVLGYMVPSAAYKISLYKCSGKKIVPEIDKRYISIQVRIFSLLVNAAVWTLLGYKSGNIYGAILMSALFTLSAVIAIIDLQINIIPNELVLIMVVLGLLFQISYYGTEALFPSLLTMLGMMLIFTSVAGAIGFGKVGAGDVKLAGAMGLTLGYPNIVVALIVLSVSLLIYSGIGLLTKKLTLRSMFPFAPFVMTGTVFTLIYTVFAG